MRSDFDLAKAYREARVEVRRAYYVSSRQYPILILSAREAEAARAAGVPETSFVVSGEDAS